VIAEDAGDGVRIDLRRGTASEEELAALIAVVSESYAREAAAAIAAESGVRTAWSVSQRQLREPLRRDLGWVRGGV
jgi:hypothetical protein